MVFVISTSVDKVGHHPEVLKSRSEVELEEVKKKNIVVDRDSGVDVTVLVTSSSLERNS